MRTSFARVAIGFVVGLLWHAPAHAQWIVFDPLNVAEAVRIVKQVMKQYTVLTQQYRQIEVMSGRLPGGLDRYRTPGIVPSVHDVTRYRYGGPLLDALNTGDARGELYRKVLGALPLIAPAISHLPESAQQVVRNQYAHLEISDSIAQRAIHQKALIAGFTGADLEAAIQALERDTLHPRTAYHYLTAVLDKLTGAELIARRQETAFNQELSHALELLILRSKQNRDTDAAVMGMRLATLHGGEAAGASIVGGSAQALRTWRQP